MLYYFSCQFLQLIEGEESTILQLAKEIAADTRHQYFEILKEGTIETRYFTDWTMGFKSIDPENFREVASFMDLNDTQGKSIAKVAHLMRILSER